jgi:hypothetical protein
MARYMERAESLARILDVNETFARDRSGAQDWRPIVQLHNDDEAFFKRHKQATADAVVNFYLIDRKNPNSIVQSVWAARENARSLRHLISVEVWSQLNVFYEFVRGLRARNIGIAELSPLCQAIKEGCQLHTGIIEGTTYRDQGWTFYQRRRRHAERPARVPRDARGPGVERQSTATGQGSRLYALAQNIHSYCAERLKARSIAAASAADAPAAARSVSAIAVFTASPKPGSE